MRIWDYFFKKEYLLDELLVLGGQTSLFCLKKAI